MIMKSLKYLVLLAISLITMGSLAADEYATPAISGYDPVAYFVSNKAMRGSGMHTSQYEGKVYLFSSAENKAQFEKTPTKYLPQYGGYCAFGVAKGKKFHTDPNVFAVVKDKLYLNLDKDIQAKWSTEKKSMIKDADKNWAQIKNTEASSL